jgi:hypothetical protein
VVSSVGTAGYSVAVTALGLYGLDPWLFCRQW